MFRNPTLTRVLIYTIPALMVAICSFIILNIVSDYSMKYINITVEIIQLVSAVVSLFGIFDCIRLRRDLLFLKIIAQALTCFILGECYWILHIYIKGFEQSGAFSIADLSWIGFYVFLLSACHTVFGPMGNFKNKHFKNFISVIAPLYILVTNTALYLSGDSLIYTLIYCLPTVFLSYYTLRFILTSEKESRIIRGFREYNLVVLLIMIVDNLICMALNYGFEDIEYILKFTFAIILLVITPAVYKGVLKWHQ